MVNVLVNVLVNILQNRPHLFINPIGIFFHGILKGLLIRRHVMDVHSFEAVPENQIPVNLAGQFWSYPIKQIELIIKCAKKSKKYLNWR